MELSGGVGPGGRRWSWGVEIELEGGNGARDGAGA